MNNEITTGVSTEDLAIKSSRQMLPFIMLTSRSREVLSHLLTENNKNSFWNWHKLNLSSLIVDNGGCYHGNRD